MQRHKGITKIANRHYQVRVRGIDERTGKRRDIKRVCRGTLQSALALQSDLREQLLRGGPHERMTLTDYTRSWLGRRLRMIKPSTANKYARDLTRHILPALGDVYIDALRPRDISDFVDAQLEHYAGNTVLNQLRLLRTIAKDALADALTDCDFCARVKPPPTAAYTEEAPNCLTAEQLDRLAREIASESPRYYALFATLAYTGMRWGEVTGLQWDDLDFDRGLIHIRRNNWKGLITTPKTTASRRAVPMVDELADILRAHRADMLARQHRGLANGWVFPTQRGTLHKGNPLNPIIHRARTRAGIDVHLTTHGLRRTFNDLARRVATGQVVRAIVGHATEAMTEHYSVIDASEKHAVQAAVIRLVSAGGLRPSASHAEGERAPPLAMGDGYVQTVKSPSRRV